MFTKKPLRFKIKNKYRRYFIKFNTIQIVRNFCEFIHRSKRGTMKTPSYANTI